MRRCMRRECRMEWGDERCRRREWMLDGRRMTEMRWWRRREDGEGDEEGGRRGRMLGGMIHIYIII